jgi:hypothetical protein
LKTIRRVRQASAALANSRGKSYMDLAIDPAHIEEFLELVLCLATGDQAGSEGFDTLACNP